MSANEANPSYTQDPWSAYYYSQTYYDPATGQYYYAPAYYPPPPPPPPLPPPPPPSSQPPAAVKQRAPEPQLPSPSLPATVAPSIPGGTEPAPAENDTALANKKKFGRFMGKLLLKSSSNKTAPPKTPRKEITQPSLETSYPDYFRVQKPRSLEKVKLTFKFASRKQEEERPVSNLSTADVLCSEGKYRHSQGRRTRWDVKPIGHDTMSMDAETEVAHSVQPNSASSENPDCSNAEDSGADDDAASVDSLQSDDDVLGPWIELGLIDPDDCLKQQPIGSDSQPTEEETKAAETWCSACDDLRVNDSGPLEAIQHCMSCSLQWKNDVETLLKAISGYCDKKKQQKATTLKKRGKKPVKAVSAKSEPKKVSKTVNDRRTKSRGKIPPTKSRKVYADQTKEKNADEDAYYTTGAFMTRNTAKQLADPEFGFRPNPYGFKHMQKVEVLNINGHWYHGILTMMHAGKVKVNYLDWDDQVEWIIMGSRRLKILTNEEFDDETQSSSSPPPLYEKSNSPDDDEAENDKLLEDDSSPQDTLWESILAKPIVKGADDYVSSTLDTDPTQIFNDNEVFMTRRMARELTDEYGFKPNSFGYRHNRAVAVTARALKQPYIGYLREMRGNKVRVWYPVLRQSEWLVVGSRRLRVLTEEEEVALGNKVDTVEEDDEVEEMPQEREQEPESKQRVIELDTSQPLRPTEPRNLDRKKKLGRPRKQTVNNDDDNKSSGNGGDENEDDEDEDTQQSVDFLTTGAFATRNAMRQLRDEHGFVPNPYGYVYNQCVEVLNTRSGRNKFWERAQLVAMKPGQVCVRYEGWSDAYDEWMMVGSRRIRPAQSETATPETSLAKPTAAKGSAKNALLVTEANPELVEEHKKKRQRLILGPEDYQKLGLLVNPDDPVKKGRGRGRQKKSQVETTSHVCDHPESEEGNDDDDEEYHTGKRRRKSKVKKVKTKGRVRPNTKAPVEDPKPTATVYSSRNHKPSDDHGFVANVYGYDYMQHVQVLHLDKKWYEGRLVSMDRTRVRVHYCGWPDGFDEQVALGSRRLQVIENDHEVECVQPDYKEQYEQRLQEFQDNPPEEPKTPATTQLLARRNRRQLTVDDPEIEYHKEPTGDAEVEEIDEWKVYCNQCNVIIKQFRYYCTYCETPSAGHDYQSFELCLRCFDQNFPFWHQHPRSSFAVQAVIDAELGPMPIKGELVTVWEEDVIDNVPATTGTADDDDDDDDEKDEGDMPGTVEASQVFSGIMEADQGYKYLKRWQRRKVCAFCNDDDDTSVELGKFIGPFVIATFNKNGVEKKRSFWAHYACAKYSPEVFCTPEGKWYNVTLALRRGRGMRCHVCKEKGATIGCFDSKCSKSFHLPCAQKPISYFHNGVIFWCTTHEAYYNKKDTYVNIFNCDGCSKRLEDESWFSCLQCASSYFSSFDLCSECFDKFPEDHAHDQEQFEETSFAILKEMEAQKATEAARLKEESRAASKYSTVPHDTNKQTNKYANLDARKKSLFPKRRRRRGADGPEPLTCCYCGTQDAEHWRKGYDGGVLMCQQCFELALLVDNDGKPSDLPLVSNQEEPNQYVTSIEDYTHKPYLTRDALSATKFSDSATGPRLASYEPQPNQLFSLVFDSTYFDIPGRAPRWASHSGTDYHGTWLPQTVRRAILKYTNKDERVLSNFLGRGTDAIECFLLQRRCCGVDINPAAVALSQRNCCFEVPPGLTSAEYRPIIAQADSRQLSGALFGDESFHHVLSHPPYKDCVAYSTHLEGDLFTNILDFKNEYAKVVRESWRLLKMGRRLTLGIGDNREHCFYIPVGFHLLREYIDNGFELEELIIKRQRYCSAFGLGTYLCVQFNFLVFTHEFIATFRKIPLECIDRMVSHDDGDSACHDNVRVTHAVKGVPSSAIARKSVVMGTVWIFKPTENLSFVQLCVSRMVERFGKDESNWEQVHLNFMSSEDLQQLPDLVNTIQDTRQHEDAAMEETDPNPLSEYEQQRLKRIEENNRTLLKLGLISELSEESDDLIHHEIMMNKPPIANAPLVLMIIGHPELQPRQIGLYRQTVVQIALEASRKLVPLGMLIIGTKDVRDNRGKLWPLSMLVLEDIERAVEPTTLKLKEMVVAVPDGYSKDRKRKVSVADEEEEGEEEVVDIVDEHLPIVHAVYLVFQRMQT
ncbi:hypothetical protein DFQ30_001412 [Apophysomyces sp. BC1015]|nr:hypothetical protein DFQ30_001412 [Apophysomyces sp. BC1015]